jgi:hypothetical protein
MSRDVCGICLCPYDDDGKCGCNALKLAEQCESDVQSPDCDCERCELFRAAADAFRQQHRETADLKRQIESMHYDLDAMSAIKEERDECYVVMRQALEALEFAWHAMPGKWEIGNAAIAALKERLR